MLLQFYIPCMLLTLQIILFTVLSIVKFTSG